MSTNDLPVSVLQRFDSGEIKWPKSIGDRGQFITERLSKIWNALLEINISANVHFLSSNLEDDYGLVEDANWAWGALGDAIVLIVMLEDVLGIDINLSTKSSKREELSVYKDKIRARIQEGTTP
jgi:hypothetical protein